MEGLGILREISPLLAGVSPTGGAFIGKTFAIRFLTTALSFC